MAGKSIPISVRISDDDAAFLASADLPGAVTPSEKIRALLAAARIDAGSTRTHEAALSRLRDWLEPTAAAVRVHELGSRQHSELVALTLNLLPELAAFVIAGPAPVPRGSEPDLRPFEAGVADRLFRLIEAVLRLAVTEKAPCYDPGIVSEGVRGALELTGVILARRTTPEGKSP